MIIQTTSLSEYILFLLAVCGEVEVDTIRNSTLASYKWSCKTISKLKNEGFVRLYRYDDESYGESSEVIRLRDGAGLQGLSKISNNLVLHYDLIRGKRGNRNKGDKRHRERTRKMAKLSHILYEQGLPVDMYRHEMISKKEQLTQNSTVGKSYLKPKSIFSDNGTLLSPMEIFIRLGSEDECFITSRALANLNMGGDRKARNLMSKAFGMIVKNDTIYPVYYLTSPLEMWSKESESSMMYSAKIMTQELRGAYDEERGSSIFYVNNPDFIINYFFPSKKMKRAIRIDDVYKCGYMLPLNENHNDIRQLLMKKDFEKRAAKLLLGKNVIDGKSYCGVLQGRKVYNLLSSDLVKMNDIKEEMKRDEGVVIIHPWQEKIAKTIYGNEAKIVKITNEEFEILISQL